MSVNVKIVYGKEQVNKLHAGLDLNKAEEKNYLKEYQFETEIEKEAFLKGVFEVVGWQEVYVKH